MKRLLALAALGALVMAGCGSSKPRRPDIVFVSSRDGAYQLYGMSADGGGQRRLTHQEGNPSTPQGLLFQVQPAWSPDGRLIAFSSKRDGPSHLFVMNADGTGTRRLTDTAADDLHPSWSPGGTELVFQRGSPGRLFVVRSDGTGARRVGRDPAEQSDPAWSPAGSWIAYSRKIPGTMVREIWLVRPDGSGRHELTHLGAVSAQPAWSPDGRRIAFSTDERQQGTFELDVVGVDGKGLRPLTLSGAGSFDPSWAPDVKTIAFWSNGSIFTVDLEGRQEQLTNGKGNDSSPVWRPARTGSSG